MERGHLQTFQEMLAEAAKWDEPKEYDDEHTAYIKTLAEGAVFTDDLAMSEMAARVDNDIQAIELAINAEKDSILFYYEMEEIIPKEARGTINKIITEEKSHLRQLAEIKKS